MKRGIQVYVSTPRRSLNQKTTKQRVYHLPNHAEPQRTRQTQHANTPPQLTISHPRTRNTALNRIRSLPLNLLLNIIHKILVIIPLYVSRRIILADNVIPGRVILPITGRPPASYCRSIAPYKLGEMARRFGESGFVPVVGLAF
jgi:hypothetical protein